MGKKLRQLVRWLDKSGWDLAELRMWKVEAENQLSLTSLSVANRAKLQDALNTIHQRLATHPQNTGSQGPCGPGYPMVGAAGPGFSMMAGCFVAGFNGYSRDVPNYGPAMPHYGAMMPHNGPMGPNNTPMMAQITGNTGPMMQYGGPMGSNNGPMVAQYGQVGVGGGLVVGHSAGVGGPQRDSGHISGPDRHARGPHHSPSTTPYTGDGGRSRSPPAGTSRWASRHSRDAPSSVGSRDARSRSRSRNRLYRRSRSPRRNRSRSAERYRRRFPPRIYSRSRSRSAERFSRNRSRSAERFSRNRFSRSRSRSADRFSRSRSGERYIRRSNSGSRIRSRMGRFSRSRSRSRRFRDRSRSINRFSRSRSRIRRLSSSRSRLRGISRSPSRSRRFSRSRSNSADRVGYGSRSPGIHKGGSSISSPLAKIFSRNVSPFLRSYRDGTPTFEGRRRSPFEEDHRRSPFEEDHRRSPLGDKYRSIEDFDDRSPSPDRYRSKSPLKDRFGGSSSTLNDSLRRGVSPIDISFGTHEGDRRVRARSRDHSGRALSHGASSGFRSRSGSFDRKSLDESESMHALQTPVNVPEDVSDSEDLRVQILRIREQKVELKLQKLEEESQRTESQLKELYLNRASREVDQFLKEQNYL